ncbi:beta-lactamase/transpeptidase-like protein, partial [Gymnopus androsaceus JB14]
MFFLIMQLRPLLFLLLTVPYGSTTSQSTFFTGPEFLTETIDKFIDDLLSSWNSPAGISVAVVQKNFVDETWHIETKGYGIAKADGAKMTENSLICIASNSKVNIRLFTAISTGLLISNKNKSTIMDVMSHRTGTSTILSRLRHLLPSAPFRTTWQYNNIMYFLLSYLPTILLPHQPPFAQYVKENIFVPLGLNDTTYSHDLAIQSGQACS